MVKRFVKNYAFHGAKIVFLSFVVREFLNMLSRIDPLLGH